MQVRQRNEESQRQKEQRLKEKEMQERYLQERNMNMRQQMREGLMQKAEETNYKKKEKAE